MSRSTSASPRGNEEWWSGVAPLRIEDYEFFNLHRQRFSADRSRGWKLSPALTRFPGPVCRRDLQRLSSSRNIQIFFNCSWLSNINLSRNTTSGTLYIIKYMICFWYEWFFTMIRTWRVFSYSIVHVNNIMILEKYILVCVCDTRNCNRILIRFESIPK
jgi:hypothetical protein